MICTDAPTTGSLEFWLFVTLPSIAPVTSVWALVESVTKKETVRIKQAVIKRMVEREKCGVGFE
jgi:hypothetical protein